MNRTPGLQRPRWASRTVSLARPVLLLLALIAMAQPSVAAGKRILLLRVAFADAPTAPVSASYAQSLADIQIEPFYR